MEYFVKCIKNYATFSGRARRKEYWMFFLFVLIGQGVCWLLALLLGKIGFILPGLFGLFILIPNLAVIVRRLHDLGKGGGWIFIVLVPVIGQIWFLILMLTAGESNANRFGPDPKAGDK